jgi:hypothetical protein
MKEAKGEMALEGKKNVKGRKKKEKKEGGCSIFTSQADVICKLSK